MIKNQYRLTSECNLLLLSVTLILFASCFSLYSKPDNMLQDNLSQLSIIQKEQYKKNQKVEEEIKAALNEIQILEGTGQYKMAEPKFKMIYDLYGKLGNSNYVLIKKDILKKKEIEFYKKWSNYIEEKATAAYLNKEWEKSVQFSKEAINILGKTKNIKWDAQKENKIIKNAENKLAEEKFREETSIDNIDPAYKFKNKDKDMHLAQAEFFIKKREFAKARNALEQVLLIDPYDYKAMTLLKQVYQQLLKVGEARSEAEQIGNLARVQWDNNQMISPKIVHGETITVEEATKPLASKIRKKLKNIIIKKVDFDNASVASVITYLNRESKILDTKDNLGINIVLRLDTVSENNTNKITMTLDEVPIGDVLKYICLSAGLKYRIEEHAVIIGNNAVEEMITKFFQIESGLINSIISNITSKANELTAGGDFYESSKFGEVDKTSKQITTEQLKVYFVQRGVPFPQGSGIAWDNKTSTLIVTNLPENIRTMESVIKEIDIQIPLVSIETKFIEITQTELEELAFKWQFYMTGDKLGINQWSKFAAGGDTTPNGNDTLLRYLNGNGTPTRPGSADTQAPDVGALVNDLTSQFGNGWGLASVTNIQFWMYALDRSKTAEVLSSPKVITKSGSRALIRMVEEKYFPTEWSEPSLSLVDNSVSGNFSAPKFENPTDLGIRLEVTPTVSPNNHTIYLDLYPEVIDMVGWEDYSYNITQVTTDNLGSPPKVEYYPTPLKMARISHRDVTTNVKIYDGETIVLGGMITENSTYVDDGYPIIGDIPLVGRLFRSKFENTVKKNLLIFVSARLINPDGTSIRKHEKGLFNFYR